MATIFPREEKAEYLFDKILENPQACERLMETFYESLESDGEYSGEVLPPEKFAKALFDAYKNKDLTAFLLAICQHSMFDLLRNAYLVPFRFNADGHTNPYILTDGSGNLLNDCKKAVPDKMYHKFQKHNLSVKLGSIAAIRKRMLQLRDRTKQRAFFERGDTQNIGMFFCTLLKTITQIIIICLISIHKIR